MMKQEFEARIKRTVSAEDYQAIETVYMLHPIIDEVNGKDQIAKLYDIGGMALINNMVPRAQEAQKMQNEISHFRREVEEANEGKLVNQGIDSEIKEIKELLKNIDKQIQELKEKKENKSVTSNKGNNSE